MKLKLKKDDKLFMSIYRCADMWQWIYEYHISQLKRGIIIVDTNRIKTLYPRFVHNSKHNERMKKHYYCYSCEYVGMTRDNRTSVGCGICPLKECWGGGACFNSLSPYCKWIENNRGAAKYAKVIADWCWNWLRNEGGAK